MARFDIMPIRSARGSARNVLAFQMGGGVTDSDENTSWRAGNIVRVDAAVGDLNPHTDGAADPADGTYYIAAADSADIIAINGGTSGADPHPFEAEVFDLTDGTEFVTANVYSGNDTELDLDSGFQVGDTFDLWVDDVVTTVDGHRHGIDLAGDFFTCVRKLDSLGRNSDISGATTTRVVFRRVG